MTLGLRSIHLNNSIVAALISVTLMSCGINSDSNIDYDVSDDDIESNCADVPKNAMHQCRLALFDTVEPTEIVEAPATGVALGWGWNRGDASPIPTICIEFVPGEEPAQTRYMTMSEVNDTHELMQSLNVSAEASVKAAVYDVSGKAAFAKSNNFSSTSSTFVLNAVVQNGVRYTAPIPDANSATNQYQEAVTERGGTSGAIRLTDNALSLAIDDTAAFQRVCGSSYVSAIYGGSKLTATITQSAETRSEKEKMSAEMSGSGWGGRFKAKVTASAEATETNSSDKMEISIFLTGGRGDAIPTSEQDLLDKLETLSLDAYVAPKDFQIATTPYELVSNWPGKLLPDPETEFEELSSYWGAYKTIYDEIEAIILSPTDYHELANNGSHFISRLNESCDTQETEVNNFQNELMESIRSGTVYQDITAYTESYEQLIGLQTALTNCQLAAQELEVFPQEVNLAKLKELQDEVLEGLAKLELKAQECNEQSAECDFNTENYTSPYALRIRLPLPDDAEIKTADEAIYHNIGRIAKNKCDRSANDSGCLSNAEIINFAQEIGWRAMPSTSSDVSNAVLEIESATEVSQ